MLCFVVVVVVVVVVLLQAWLHKVVQHMARAQVLYISVGCCVRDKKLHSRTAHMFSSKTASIILVLMPKMQEFAAKVIT